MGSEQHSFGDSPLDEIHHLREKVVREDISKRLRKVCSNLSDEEFDKLVALMADRQVKRERRLI